MFRVLPIAGKKILTIIAAMATLETTRDVIAALGGVHTVARVTGRTYNCVHNWTKFPTFPSNTYVAIIGALAAKGYSAPPSLFGMVIPERDRAA